jgi:Domain of unknown function (DUF4234)
VSTIEEPTGHAYAQPSPPPAGHAQPQYAPVPQHVGQPQYGQFPPVGHPLAVAPVAPGVPMGPVGKVRSTWAVIGLSLITFGIYGLYYHFATHEEMKQHSGPSSPAPGGGDGLTADGRPARAGRARR